MARSNQLTLLDFLLKKGLLLLTFSPLISFSRKNVRLASICSVLWLFLIDPSGFPALAAGDETPSNGERAPVSSSESFQTALFTGGFSDAVPIIVPPGTKLQPTLALAYNSSSTSSQTFLGAGWSLSGLGSIDRSSKKGVPLYNNTNGDPTTGTDQYMLNLGATHDLVHISADSRSPFHTKIETFLRINFITITHPHPTKGGFATVYWVVTDKNGTQFRFGFNADSNVIALNPDGTSKRATRAWYLDRVTDTHGNYMEISYAQDTLDSTRPNNGGIYPSKISYTKNDSAPLNSLRTIDFIYEQQPRPDIVTDYSSGSLVKTDRRLKSIDIKVSGTLVRSYQLTYKISPVSGKSLFKSIQQIGADAASNSQTTLPPTTFTYQENLTQWAKDSGWSGSIPAALLKDGKFDGVQVVDVNGDSLPDFVKSISTASGGTVKQVWLNNGSGWSAPNVAWANTIPISFSTDGVDNGVRLVDVNGDGAPDFVQSTDTSKAVWLNTGTGWSATPDPTWSASIPISFLGPVGNVVLDQGVQLVDVNGDGLPDIVQNLKIENYQKNRCVLVPNCPGNPICGNSCNKEATTDYFLDSTSSSKGVWINTGNGWAQDIGLTNGLPAEPLTKIISKKDVANCNPQYEPDPAPHPGLIIGCVISDQGLITNTIRPVDTWTRFMDANGDGLLDIISSLVDGLGNFITKQIFLNTGRGWISDAGYSNSIPKGLAKKGTEVDDYTSTGTELISLNGNRGSDLVSFSPDGTGSFTHSVFLNWLTGWTTQSSDQDQRNAAWTTAIASLPNGQLTNDRQLVGHEFIDLNGDGLPDYLVSTLDTSTNLPFKEVHLANGPAPDLLIQVQNNSGGKTIVQYKPAVQYLGSAGEILNSKVPFVIQTVLSVVSDSGITGQPLGSVTYSYSGGLFDGASREFRGFRSVKVIDPAGAYTESFFLQDNTFKGRVDFTEVRNGPNPLNLFSRVVNSWDYSSAYSGVIFPFLLKEDHYVYDGLDIPQRTETLYQYDAYGNIKTVNSRGDLSKTGDERIDGVDFIYNDTSSFYIVSHPARRFTTDDFGTILTQTWFGYDGAVVDPANPSANEVPPTKGDVTSIVDWFPEGANPKTTFNYDVYGNQVKITDARGNSSKTVFDSLFYSVPIIETNAKEQSIIKKYYGIDVPVGPDGPIPGLLASVTDLNQLTMSYKYDALGRVTQEIIPPDTAATPTVQYFYERDGIPPESTLMKKRDTSPNGGGTSESVTFTDGFGRVIQSKRESHDSSMQVAVDQIYNNRGQVESSSIPYLVQGPLTYSAPSSQQPKTTTLYDPVGRVTTITSPDGSYVTSTPLQWSTTIINSNGQKRVESRDAYGQLIKVEEYKGNDGRTPPAEGFSLYATTEYQYDLFGRLKKVIDEKKNETIISYDSLGRKKSILDPDLGNWSYEYDAIGNLKRQIDAKGQSIYFSYDALNRLISKGVQEDTRPPTVPTNVTATATSTGYGINLAWSASSDNARVEAYDIYRNGSASPVGRSSTLSFIDTNLSPNTTYSYTVSAIDPAGNASAQSSPSASGTTRPDTVSPDVAPSNTSAVAVSETQVNVSWVAAHDDVGIAGYKIERFNSPSWVEIGSSAVPFFADNTVVAWEFCEYRVRGYDAAGNYSNYSAISPGVRALDLTPPPPVSGILMVDYGGTTVYHLTWNWNCCDNSGYPVRYNIVKGPPNPITRSTGASFMDFDRTARATYTVYVIDSAGNISQGVSVTFP